MSGTIQAQAVVFTTPMLTSPVTPAQQPPRPRRERGAAPRLQPPAAGQRWIGTLYCRTPECARPLAEVFADAANLTYLPQIGGGRVRAIGIECPHCGATRQFQSVLARPAAPLPVAANLVYDTSTNEQ